MLCTIFIQKTPKEMIISLQLITNSKNTLKNGAWETTWLLRPANYFPFGGSFGLVSDAKIACLREGKQQQQLKPTIDIFNYFGSLFNQQKHAWCWWHLPSWWLNQPIWKIFVKLVHLRGIGANKFKQKMVSHHLVTPCNFLTQDSGWQKSAIFSRAFEVTNNKQGTLSE